MNRPAQRIIIVVLALLLVVPIGVMGLGGLLGDRSGSDVAEPSVTVNTEDNRPTVDPAEQPPRPQIDKPAEPDAVRVQDAAGAEATLTYLLESYTYMMTTGDTSVWSNAIDPNCEACTSFLSNAQTLNDQGGYLVDGEFTVRSATFAGTGEPPGTGVVTADFYQEPSTLVDDPNRQNIPLDEISGQLLATAVWNGERWVISDMSIVDSPAVSDGGADAAAG